MSPVCVLAISVSFILLNACTKKDLQPSGVVNDGVQEVSTGMGNVDAGSSVSEVAVENQMVAEQPVLSVAVPEPATCESQLSQLENPEQWDCVDGTSVCMDRKGCRANGRLYPKWGYIGKLYSPEYITEMPDNFEDYILLSNPTPEGKALWFCGADACQCGSKTIKHLDRCHRDSWYPRYSESCGSQTCPKGSGCRDGMCTCDGLPLKEITHATVQASDWVCEEDQLVCHNYKGCSCGTATCIPGTVCTPDGKCLCNGQEVTGADQYRCSLSDNMMKCFTSAGCQCGDVIIPNNSDCIDRQGYCHGKPIDRTIKNPGEYKCADDAPMLVCGKDEGCTCGDQKCMPGAECYNGECWCGRNNKALFNETENELSECRNGSIYQFRYSGEEESGSYIDEAEDEMEYVYTKINPQTGERKCPEYEEHYVSCHDCEDLTCKYKDSFEHGVSLYEWMCKVYHGCTVMGNAYAYGKEVNIPEPEPGRCGTEPLRAGYLCRDHQQVCNLAEGCPCGELSIAKDEVCTNHIKSQYIKPASGQFCKCSSKNTEMHCPYKALTRDQFELNNSFEARCGDRTIHYSLLDYGNDDDHTDIPYTKASFDVCCLCLNDNHAPDDVENYLCNIEYDKASNVAGDYVRISAGGKKFVPVVSRWTCRNPQKCTPKAACEMGEGFEWNDRQQACLCGGHSVEPTIAEQLKCQYGVILCKNPSGCQLSGQSCKFTRICM